MVRIGLLPSPCSLEPVEVSLPADDLIRPALRKAFPLPPKEQASDDRFQRLLDALARKTGKDG